jgi:hypothetical protein
MALKNFAARRIKELLGQVGFGGPGLTNAAFFQAGVDLLRGTMSDNQTAYLDYNRQARRKTFAKKHGAALETSILRFTGQPDEAHLPEIHRLMTNAGGVYSILNSQFAEHATALDLPLTAANAPLSTPAILDQVFHNIATSSCPRSRTSLKRR